MTEPQADPQDDRRADPQAVPPDAASYHEPVLVRQVLELFAPQPGMVCLDCTVGLGGHAAAIAPRLAPGGRYVGLDVDPGNIELARRRLAGASARVDLVRSNFAGAGAVLDELGTGRVDLLLADLGFASNQMRDSQRGLSFQVEGPLDMRLDPDLPQTAGDLINTMPQEELADLIYRYGEERYSRRIARKIVEHRGQSPINTTTDLAQLVRHAYGRAGRRGHRHPGRMRIDPATRTFMALRIAVNAELAALERLLGNLPHLLRPGAVAALISFHSLEDRMVKRAFASLRSAGLAEVLTRKPLVADEDEQRRNPRARSAKLRAVRWLEAPDAAGC